MSAAAAKAKGIPPGPPLERRRSLASMAGIDEEYLAKKAAGMTQIELDGGYKTWVTLAKRPEGMLAPIRKPPKKTTKPKRGSNNSCWSVDAVILAGHDRASLRFFLARRGIPEHLVDAAVDDAIYKWNKEHPDEPYAHSTEDELTWCEAEARALNCHGSDWDENVRNMFKQPIVSKHHNVRPFLSMMTHGVPGKSIDMCDPARYRKEGEKEDVSSLVVSGPSGNVTK